MPYFFGGQLIETPAVASFVDDSAMLSQGASVGNDLAIVGKAAGGQPKTALVFQSPDDARATLASGDLLDAVIRAFDPSSETGGPETVTAVRVDPALQSSLQLRDSLAAVVVTLTSEGYGQRENQIKAKVEAATGGRGLKLTTQRGNDYYTSDNVYRDAFSVQYTGSQASGVLSITGTQVTLEAPSGTSAATLNLNTFPTVAQLVDAINAVSGFTASVLDGNDDAPTLQGLDFVTAQDIKTAAYTARADLQAAVDWFNSDGEGFVTATREPDVGTLPAAMAFTYLTGGTDGAATNTDWTDSFQVLQTVDVQWVSATSSDPSIHAMVDAHVAYMSTTARKERRAVVGAPLATTDAAALTLAKAINSDRTSFVHLGGYDYDANGKLTLYPPYIVGAMVAGAFAGVSPGTPLTGKSLKLRGVERNLRNPADTDALVRGGVLAIENTPTGYRVVQSISTWLTNTKFNRREQSCGAATDYAARQLREAVEAVAKGQKGTPQVLGIVRSAAVTALNALSVPEPNGPGVLAGDATNPPWKDLTVSLNGDAVEVSVQVSPVIPINYGGITIHVVPYQGSASA